MIALAGFISAGVRGVFTGPWLYRGWMAGLGLVVLAGVFAYRDQYLHGLVVTGMSDQISWGAYIANFTYLVGVAAAAVMLVIPAYIFNREDIRHVVLIGEAIAVSAVIMCILFVTVDMGRPERIWHMIPYLGRLNFPASMLAWDVLVLTGYLLLNLGIPFYLLFSRYRGKAPDPRIYMPFVLLAMFWAISIHTVTAFLFSSNISRPFWNTAILGPRFLASAFCSGPALIIIALEIIDRLTRFKVNPSIINTLALITTVALQINLFLLGVEIFTDFYSHNNLNHLSAEFLYFGLQGNNALVPAIWTAIAFDGIAVVILTIHPLRQRKVLMHLALGLLIVGVWIDKGMGLIVPGFVPTPLGEVFFYTPTWNEVLISIGIWALGFIVFTALVKIGIGVELGDIVWKKRPGARNGQEPGALPIP